MRLMSANAEVYCVAARQSDHKLNTRSDRTFVAPNDGVVVRRLTACRPSEPGRGNEVLAKLT